MLDHLDLREVTLVGFFDNFFNLDETLGNRISQEALEHHARVAPAAAPSPQPRHR